MTDFFNDELETKPEVVFNVWANTGKAFLENIGSVKTCIGELNNMAYADKSFKDERTKEKVDF